MRQWQQTVRRKSALVAWQVMGCVTAGEEDSWGGAHAETTLLVAQLGAGVTTGLHLAGQGLGQHTVRGRGSSGWHNL